MIQQDSPIVQKFIKQNWKKSLKDAFYKPEDLLRFLEININQVQISQIAQKQFKMIVPKSFANRIEKGNLNDPLLKQVLPILDEEIIDKNYINDPLDEQTYNKIPGLLHKYHSRVLLIAHSACAIHCRYCFRRVFNYKDNIPGKENWLKAFDYIKNDSSIEEVILSGGDPLLHDDKNLQFFIDHIKNIPHIKRLRIHSRIPVTPPERITPELIKLLTNHHLDTILVIHANHPNEINDEIIQILKEVQKNNILILNQSTLLKGINDNTKILHQLSTKLIQASVLPYYIHLLDKVSGSCHFNVEIDQAKKILKELSEISSGFMVPKLAQEMPGFPSKTWLGFME